MKWHDIESSTAKQIKYEKGNMHVVFKNNREYMYIGVPEYVFEELIKGNSFGKLFNKYIKNEYSTIELD